MDRGSPDNLLVRIGPRMNHSQWLRLLVSVAQVLKLGQPFADWGQAKHYFIHLLFSPDGSRFIFLHRWRTPQKHAGTRMFTAAADGSDIRLIDANGMTSHFIWRDERHILAWSDQPSRGKRFYLFDDGGEQKPEPVGPEVMLSDGHCTYLPGNAWILNDSYPDKQRNQNPYLYEVKSGRRVALGHFPVPPEYSGEWRVDTHPRFSPDGKKVVIDSAHGGLGRQMYLIDIARVVG
ncbi:WD40-like Beta Propeller Repeat [Singulisphaera sp. GP187]|nr:WD40-like Beta Propeller Repeat [Singulisphaera sp. GP187]